MNETPNVVVPNPKNRSRLYLAAAAIGIAGILATLVMLGILKEEQINSWVTLTITLTTLIATTAATLLARVNTPSPDGEAGSEYQGKHVSE